MQTLQRVLRFLDRQSLWSALLLRVAVGATFTAHGAGKVFGSSILAFTPPVPLGGVLGPLVPIIEFFGGIFLILGLGTRVWALLQAGVMIFAIAFVHGGQGFKMKVLDGHAGGWEWQALLLAATLTLVIGGPGIVSVDALLRRRFGKATVDGSA